jgi:RNA processing factor Prp31
MYYMYCDRRNFTGSFPSFVELFMSGLVLYTPYWAHLSLAWSHKDFQNFLFLFYEDVIQDLDEHIKGIAQFIETEVSNEQIELLKGKLMSQERVLETSRKFIGEKLEVDDEFNVEGLEEDWREFYTEKMNDRVDEWITVNLEKIGAMIGI